MANHPNQSAPVFLYIITSLVKKRHVHALLPIPRDVLLTNNNIYDNTTTKYLKAAVVRVLCQTHPWHVHILHENIASLVVLIPQIEGRRAPALVGHHDVLVV